MHLEEEGVCVNKDDFLGITHAVFSRSPAGHGDLAGFVNYTNDGVCAIGGDDVGRLGFGIAAGITPDFSVLSAVGELCCLMNYGHFWLAEGADNNNWSLVCGFKFPYDAIEPRYVGEIATGMVHNSRGIIDVALQKLDQTPHRPYWQPTTPDLSPETQAFVLIGHLG